MTDLYLPAPPPPGSEDEDPRKPDPAEESKRSERGDGFSVDCSVDCYVNPDA